MGRYIPIATATIMSGLMLATEFGAKIHPIIDNTPDYKDIPWLLIGSGISLGYGYLRAKNLD